MKRDLNGLVSSSLASLFPSFIYVSTSFGTTAVLLRYCSTTGGFYRGLTFLVPYRSNAADTFGLRSRNFFLKNRHLAANFRGFQVKIFLQAIQFSTSLLPSVLTRPKWIENGPID